MNFFQLIKLVLDDLYMVIPGDNEQKDQTIYKAMLELQSWYRNILTAPEERATEFIDYSLPEVRFAYIYKYTTAHASYIHQLMLKSDALSNLFDHKRVRVSCIGGGPGSDFLGILKYMNVVGKRPHVTCYLYDKEIAWGQAWGDVGEHLQDTDIRMFPIFQPIDITVEEAWKNTTRIHSSDLITISYFMSEILLNPGADEFFENVFESVKPGALVFFLDNNLSDVYGWFDDLALSNNMEIIDCCETTMWTTHDEQKIDLHPYYGRFQDPKLRSQISYRVARKIDSLS